MAVKVRASLEVREAFGIRGSGIPDNFQPPPEVQCYGCNVKFKPKTVTKLYMSAVCAGPNLYITAWSHPRCGDSRIFTPEEFEQMVSRVRPARGLAFGAGAAPTPEYDPPAGTTLLMFDGKPVSEIVIRDDEVVLR